MQKRKAGTILHLSSLPGKDAIGTILDGIPFLGLMKKAGLRTWQVLPIGPTIIGDSPFQGPSAFAGNPNLISLEQLVKAGDLSPAALKRYIAQHAAYLRRYRKVTPETVHYEFLWRCKIGFDHASWGYKNGPLRAAYQTFKLGRNKKRQQAYAQFVKRWDKVWLADYAMFMALKAAYGFPKQWSSWKAIDRFRRPGFGAKARRDDIEFFKYVQFVFDEQMQLLHAAAKGAGIEIVGDIPMYPAYDSSDVWANPELFQLGDDLKATHVACVPPDNFNPKGGQLWGNPLYKWGIMGNAQSERRVFDWWEKRLRSLFVHHDVIKIDHFRGLVAYGRVSAKSRNACAARWTAGPGSRMLKAVQKKTGRLDIIAEDLGVITPAVGKTLRELQLPGMRLLQFGNFRDKRSSHLPSNAPDNAVCYTGTHDNPTLLEWFCDYCDIEQRRVIDSYLREQSAEAGFSWRAIDTVFRSRAARAIVPMQDILELGGEARMNFPSKIGYWRWRMSERNWEQLRQEAVPRLRRLAVASGRAGK